MVNHGVFSNGAIYHFEKLKTMNYFSLTFSTSFSLIVQHNQTRCPRSDGCSTHHYLLYVLRQSSLYSSHYSHLFFALMIIFLALVSSTEEGHICRPPFGAHFHADCFARQRGSLRATCYPRIGLQGITIVVLGCNKNVTLVKNIQKERVCYERLQEAVRDEGEEEHMRDREIFFLRGESLGEQASRNERYFEGCSWRLERCFWFDCRRYFERIPQLGRQVFQGKRADWMWRFFWERRGDRAFLQERQLKARKRMRRGRGGLHCQFLGKVTLSSVCFRFSQRTTSFSAEL